MAVEKALANNDNCWHKLCLFPRVYFLDECFYINSHLGYMDGMLTNCINQFVNICNIPQKKISFFSLFSAILNFMHSQK